MTDWEKAIAKWLPEVWTPKPCKGDVYIRGVAGESWRCNSCWLQFVERPDFHYIPCPPPSPELGFQLLEAMLRKSAEAIRFEFMSELFLLDTIDGPVFDGPDLLTAIIKAAAALAEKDEQP